MFLSLPSLAFLTPAPLLGLTLNFVAVWALVATIVAGLLLGKVLFKDRRALKAFQALLDELAFELARVDFTLLPPILSDLAREDLVKLAHDVKNAIDVVKSPKKFAADMEKIQAGLNKQSLTDRQTAQPFLDSIVREAALLGLQPSTQALAGQADPGKQVNLASAFGANALGVPAFLQQAAGQHVQYSQGGGQGGVGPQLNASALPGNTPISHVILQTPPLQAQVQVSGGPPAVGVDHPAVQAAMQHAAATVVKGAADAAKAAAAAVPVVAAAAPVAAAAA